MTMDKSIFTIKIKYILYNINVLLSYRSSAVEHPFHKRDVTGSNPVDSTLQRYYQLNVNMKNLTVDDILLRLKQEIYVQDYSKKMVIEGIKIIEVKKFFCEDGTFEELTRINEHCALEAFPDFKVRQINRSKILAGSIKAWHLHYKQEDIWYVPPEIGRASCRERV